MIEIGKKYGCLTVIDDGEEYRKTVMYSEWLEKEKELRQELEPYFATSQEIKDRNPEIFNNKKQQILSDADNKARNKLRQLVNEYCFVLSDYHELCLKLEKHYKCVCKCGRMHLYNAITIESKPRYCIYPVPIATKHTYSISAIEATQRKEMKYEKIESVLLRDKAYCIPSDEYCALYNRYKEKQLSKKDELLQLEIASIPRTNAKNFDIDYIGKQYESLFVEECSNEHLESKPFFSYSQCQRKHWHTITVYKQYKCKCMLCGKIHYVTCDKFGIYPPTEYGYHAYNGYWSDVFCDCHPISSFQWIVNKILMENDIPYQAEYSFPDLYGIAGVNKLRFDFAVFDENGSIKALIECQGEQHYNPVEEFGGTASYNKQQKNDDLKREYALKHNYKIIEISFRDKQYDRIKEILIKSDILI